MTDKWKYIEEYKRLMRRYGRILEHHEAQKEFGRVYGLMRLIFKDEHRTRMQRYQALEQPMVDITKLNHLCNEGDV